MLRRYDWPGNIRELENVIERAVILSGVDGVIDVHHLPAWMQDQEQRLPESAAGSGTLEESLSALEKRLIMDAMDSCSGFMAQAAEKLGVTERIMGLRMKRYGLEYKSFRKLARDKDE
jgi:Nif-specific regulatory protein